MFVVLVGNGDFDLRLPDDAPLAAAPTQTSETKEQQHNGTASRGDHNSIQNACIQDEKPRVCVIERI